MEFIGRLLSQKKYAAGLFVIFVWLGTSGLSVFGQVLTGSVVGNVTDASGAVVPEADVTLRNVDTNEARHATTSSIGAYSFESIPPATYQVNVTKTGFTSVLRSGLTVGVNSVVRADVALQVGSATQTVTVTANAAQLQTETADVHAEITTQHLADLPIPPGRNYQELFATLPGFSAPQSQVSIPGNPSRSLLFTANGANEEGIVTRIDGATSTNIWRPNAVAYIPALESVQSVNTVTNSFTAENGTAGGALVNVTVKSGTNSIHGSVFEYYDGSATEARPYFLPASQSNGNLVENQFGGTLGGPIRKDKLFYFVSYEGSRNHQLENGGLISIPTLAERAGDFRASPTPIYDPATGAASGAGRTQISCNGILNTICQSRIPSAIQKLLQLWPTPTLPGDQNNYFASGPFHLDRNTVDAKMNWNVSPKLTAFLRFGYLHYGTYNGQNFGDTLGGAPLNPTGGQSGNATGSTYSVTGSATYVKSATLVLDSYYGYTLTNGNSQQDNLNIKIGSDVLGIPGTNGPYWFEGGWPQFTIANFASIGAPNTFEPDILSDPEYEWVFNVGKTKGAHSMRFGVDISRQNLNELQVQPFGGGGQFGAQGGFSFAVGQTSIPGAKTSEYNSFASFVLGSANTLGTSVLNPPTEYSMRSWQYAAYVQDQWQVNPKLTLTYGLRWENFPMPTRATRGVEFYNVNNNNMYICGYGVVPQNCGLKMSNKLFEPRFGIAYRVSNGLVMRAGYGLSHDPYNLLRQFRVNYPLMISENITAPNSFAPAGNVQNGIPTVTEPSFGDGVISIPGNVAAQTVFPGQFKRGYIQSWNFTVEKAIGAWTAQAGYVGTRETDQLAEVNLNAGTVGGGAASEPLNILYGRTASTVAEAPIGTFKYDSLQVSVQHKLTHGIQFGAGYTLARDFGVAGSTNNDGSPLVQAPGYYQLNLGRTPLDRRHSLSISSVVQLPFGSDKPFAKGRVASAILGGWQINGLFTFYSGAPFQVSAPGTSLNAPGSTQRAQLVAPVKKLGGIGTGNPYYDPTTFAQVTTATFGNFPFYELNGPPTHPVNMGLFRTFKLWEHATMQFRAEAYNVLNMPDFAAPSGTVGNSSFMVITNVQNTGREGIDQRMFRFGLRLGF